MSQNLDLLINGLPNSTGLPQTLDEVIGSARSGAADWFQNVPGGDLAMAGNIARQINQGAKINTGRARLRAAIESRVDFSEMANIARQINAR
ncbi:MAG: hypothetical protein LBO08_01710 [Rickettsiales bacterium]|jgi:hypothetical protein|nr:hypothetical protein [Rickettsiales bacterium]